MLGDGEQWPGTCLNDSDRAELMLDAGVTAEMSLAAAQIHNAAAELLYFQ